MKDTRSILVRKPEGKNHFGDLGIDGRGNIKLILQKLNVKV
jgi:hypothetical protein